MRGVEVVITKDDLPVVKLVPLPRAKPRPQFGSAKGLEGSPWLSRSTCSLVERNLCCHGWASDACAAVHGPGHLLQEPRVGARAVACGLAPGGRRTVARA
jgi:antitoxin (DNA-binding transcriptional repressor) of toxin-antitoxin stability system